MISKIFPGLSSGPPLTREGEGRDREERGRRRIGWDWGGEENGKIITRIQHFTACIHYSLRHYTGGVV
jgi:hypothetical protein